MAEAALSVNEIAGRWSQPIANFSPDRTSLKAMFGRFLNSPPHAISDESAGENHWMIHQSVISKRLALLPDGIISKSTTIEFPPRYYPQSTFYPADEIDRYK
jgi:hypothetical protein